MELTSPGTDIRAPKNLQKHFHPLRGVSISFSIQNSPQAAAQQQESDTTQQAEREVTRMVIVMVMAFLICWLPYTTFALVVATNKGIVIQPALASLPSYFSKTATVYNPIIYVFMNKQVREKTIS